MAFLVQVLGCSSKHFIRVTLIGSFWDLILSFWSSVPGSWSVGCIGSNVTFLCGVVCFSTCLTGWVDSFWLPFSSIAVFVIIVADIAVRVRGIGVTVFVSGFILIVFSLFSLFFQQAALVSVMSCFFIVVARWFCSVSFSVCGLLAHSVYP